MALAAKFDHWLVFEFYLYMYFIAPELRLVCMF